MAAALAAAGVAAPAFAQEAYVIYQLTPTGTETVVSNPAGTVSASGATWSATDPKLTGTATVRGSAAMVGSAAVAVTGSGAGFDAFAYAGWTDTLTIDAAGLSGQHGTLLIEFTHGNSHSFVANGVGSAAYAESFIDTNFQAVGTMDWQYAYVGRSLTVSNCDAAGQCDTTTAQMSGYDLNNASNPALMPVIIDANTAMLQFDIVFGQRYALNAAVNSWVSGVAGVASADGSFSLGMDGLSVLDANGGNVAFTLASASGLSYPMTIPGPLPPAPVPEPAEWLLMSLGLAALTWRVKARRA